MSTTQRSYRFAGGPPTDARLPDVAPEILVALREQERVILLAWRAMDAKGEPPPSVGTIAERLGISTRYVSQSEATLRRVDLIGYRYPEASIARQQEAAQRARGCAPDPPEPVYPPDDAVARHYGRLRYDTPPRRAA